MLQEGRKKLFCLLEELDSEHDCAYHHHDSESDMSQLLFDSPTIAADIPDTGGTGNPSNITCSEMELFSTPKLPKRNKAETPHNLVLDSCNESWSQEMATPTPLRSSVHKPYAQCIDSIMTDSAMNSFELSVCTKNSRKSTKRLNSSRKTEQKPRRLFHSDVVANDGNEKSTTAEEPGSSLSGSGQFPSLNLDVLFMSNSELDQFEQLHDSTSEIISDSPTVEHKAAVSPCSITESENIFSSAVRPNKFIYPTSSQIERTMQSQKTDHNVVHSLKRPSCPQKFSPSVKKPKSSTTYIPDHREQLFCMPQSCNKSLVNKSTKSTIPPQSQSVLVPNVRNPSSCIDFGPRKTSTPFNAPRPLTARIPQHVPKVCKNGVADPEDPVVAKLIDDQNAVEFEVNWEEFNSFTQLHEPCKQTTNNTEKEMEYLLSTSSINAFLDVSHSESMLESNTLHSRDDGSSGSSIQRAVGFATASGKPITIQEASVQKVLKLINEELPCSEIPNSSDFDTELSMNVLAKDTHPAAAASSMQSDCISKDLMHVSDNQHIINPPIRSESLINNTVNTAATDFVTGGGKAVSVLKASLMNFEKLVYSDDIPGEEALNRIAITDIPTDSANDTVDYLSDAPTHIPVSSKGFTTASGKQVSVRVESLQAAKKLFQEERSISARTGNEGGMPADGGSVFALNRKGTHVNDNVPCMGFTAASGKAVLVNEESLKAVRSIFQEVEGSDFTPDIEERELSCLESSFDANEVVSNSSSQVAEEHCKDFQTITSSQNYKATDGVTYSDVSNERHENSNKAAIKGSFGFTTASGKTVSISDKSLNAVRGVFQEDDCVPSNIDDTHSKGCSQTTVNRMGGDIQMSVLGFTTASGKSVSVAQESLQAVKRFLNDDKHLKSTSRTKGINQQSINTRNDTSQNDGATLSKPIGFTTAAGKSVCVTEESLQAVRGLLHVHDNDVHTSDSQLLARPNNEPVLDLSCTDSNHLQSTSILPSQENNTRSKSSFVCLQEGTVRDRHVYRSLIPKSSTIEWDGINSTNPASPEKCHTTITPPSPMILTDSQLELFEDTTLTQLALHDSPSILSCEQSTNIPQLPGSLMSCHKLARLPLSSLEECRRVYDREELLSLNISENVMNVSIKTASNYVFPCPTADAFEGQEVTIVTVGDGVKLAVGITDKGIGKNKLYRAFCASPGVDKSLISKDWFVNHYKWIVWKLASYEVSFPETFGGSCLTLDYCMKQLKYRYDLEIDSAKRSLIHLLSEDDETSSVPMVLCVSDVDLPNQLIEVTDGWYSMPAKIDHHLVEKFSTGCVDIGCKLFICGAELDGSNEHGHPLEISKPKCLRLFVNSVKRARWDARLGKVFLNHPPVFPLSSIRPRGGVIPCVKVIVARTFPIVYMESHADGRKSFRTIKMEESKIKEFEEIKSSKMEVLYRRAERECEDVLNREDRSKRRRSGRLTPRYVMQLKDGEALYNVLRSASDPDSLLQMISPTQQAMLQSYQELLVQKRQEMIQKHLQKAMNESSEDFTFERKSVALLRTIVVQYGHSDYCPVTSRDCIFTLWRPNNDLVELLKEGTVLKVHHATSSQKLHNGCLQLSSTKKTRYERLKVSKSKMSGYHTRVYTPINRISQTSSHLYGYIDTIGRVITVTKSEPFRGSVNDCVYVTDNEEHLLKIWLWEKVEVICLQSLLVAGSIFAFCNLQIHKTVSSTVMEAFASDKTLFLQYPTSDYLSVPLIKMRLSENTERKLLKKMELN